MNTTKTLTDRQYFFRTFRYLRPYFAVYIIGLFFYSGQSFFFPLVSGIFMGGVTEGILAQDMSVVLSAIWGVAAMMLLIMAAVGAGAYMYVITITYGTRDMSLHMFRAFMKSSIENQKHSGEGIAALNTDITTASSIFGNAISAFLHPVISIVLTSITIFIVNWQMGIASLIVGLVVFVIQSRFAAPLAKLGKQRLEANADSVKAMSNIFSGALTIRAFGRQRQSLISFNHETGKLKKIDFKQAFIGMWQDVFTTVQGWLSLILVFAFGGWLVINGQLELPQLMMIFPLASIIGQSMSNIGAAYAGLQPPVVAAKRVFSIIDAVPDLDKPRKTKPMEWNGKYEIKLKDLNFSYKDSEVNALKNINLTIKENEMVAFVGESGSGKSTLLRLLIGMYEREGLNMEIGDMPFTADGLPEWRGHFSYVDQSCKLFDMNISENIAMGKQSTATENEITEAAKRAFAHEFISALPDGYSTECGEKGASLSGGQKQRIAIARAMCRKAQVLVFDEATSALDADSERNVMQTIESLRKDHTILITTHNLHNIKTADKIVVMDNGNIAEIGTHAQLNAQNGIYNRLLNESGGV